LDAIEELGVKYSEDSSDWPTISYTLPLLPALLRNLQLPNVTVQKSQASKEVSLQVETDCKSLRNNGDLCCSIGKYKDACKYYSDCITLVKSKSDEPPQYVIEMKEQAFLAATSAGAIYMTLCNFLQAFEHFKDAFNFANELSDQEWKWITIANIASAAAG
jgi:tetratricopeptide (TPR) repeat protein